MQFQNNLTHEFPLHPENGTTFSYARLRVTSGQSVCFYPPKHKIRQILMPREFSVGVVPQTYMT